MWAHPCLVLVATASALNSTAASFNAVGDTYCSEEVIRTDSDNYTSDFDCLRDPTANTSSVKFLGVVASTGECETRCRGYAYRESLPCRAFTHFGQKYSRPQFRGNCYARVDNVLNRHAVENGVTSATLGLGDCSTDMQCELNGQCADGKCHCHPGWAGQFCERLDLQPAKPANGYRRANYSSWGGSLLFDEKRGKWLMFVAEMAAHCGLNSWFKNSRIVRAVSASGDPEGPYSPEAVVKSNFAHEPTVHPVANLTTVSTDGSGAVTSGPGWVMWMIGHGNNCRQVQVERAGSKCR